MCARACVYIILYFMYILSCTASPVHPVWFLRPVRRAHRARWCCGVRDSNSWYTKITQDGNLDFFPILVSPWYIQQVGTCADRGPRLYSGNCCIMCEGKGKIIRVKSPWLKLSLILYILGTPHVHILRPMETLLTYL